MAKLHLLLKTFTLLFSLQASNVLAGTGVATFYTDQSQLACPGAKDHGELIAAVSDKLWDGGHVCGKKMTIHCLRAVEKGVPHACRGNGDLTVTIRDFCKNCRGLIDLTAKGFASIANLDAGEIFVSFHFD